VVESPDEAVESILGVFLDARGIAHEVAQARPDER